MPSVQLAVVTPTCSSQRRQRLAQVAPGAQAAADRHSDEEEASSDGEAVGEECAPAGSHRTKITDWPSRSGSPPDASLVSQNPTGIVSPYRGSSQRTHPSIPDVDRHAGGGISSNRSVGGVAIIADSDSVVGDGLSTEEMTVEQEEALAAALLHEVAEQCDVLDDLVAEAEAAQAFGSELVEETDSEDDEDESKMLATLVATYAQVDEQLRILTQKLGEDETSDVREAEQADLVSANTGNQATARQDRDDFNKSDLRASQLHATDGERSAGVLPDWLFGYCVLM